MADITVPVPDDRTAEFYQFFGLWLAGSLSLMQGPPGALEAPPEASEVAKPHELTPWGTTDQDFADAETLWRKYSPRARAMFSLLIDNPDTEYTGVQVAEAVGIPNGAHGVAGVLAWPGRHGFAIGRGLPTEWREDPDTFEGMYRMPAKRAEMFKTVRAKVEGDS